MTEKNTWDYHYTYMIQNSINDKIYIGAHSTNDLDDGYLGSNTELKNDIKIHGIDKFKKTILFFFDTRKKAFEYERLLVDKSFVDRPDTYNNEVGGGWANITPDICRTRTCLGRPRSEETKERIRQSMIGKNVGKEHTLATRDKISKSMTGKPQSEEKRRKCRESKLGENNPNYGKKRSVETRAKISAALRGKPRRN